MTGALASNAMRFVLWLHLVAASVWVGGLITLGALVAALRKAGADRGLLQVMARQFGRVSWSAMAVAVLSGAWLAVDYIDRPALAVKVGLVAVTAGLAGWHQLAARNQSPAMRGVLQGLILLFSLAVIAAALAI